MASERNYLSARQKVALGDYLRHIVKQKSFASVDDLAAEAEKSLKFTVTVGNATTMLRALDLPIPGATFNRPTDSQRERLEQWLQGKAENGRVSVSVTRLLNAAKTELGFEVTMGNLHGAFKRTGIKRAKTRERGEVDVVSSSEVVQRLDRIIVILKAMADSCGIKNV